MLSVTPDTNILISGLVYKRGKPYELLKMAAEGALSLTVSPHILDELSDVLARKFDATAEEISEAKDIVTAAARVVIPSARVDVVRDDPSDNRILECALSSGSRYIVTGDKHLLRLKKYEGVEIMTVANFLEFAKGQGPER